jgi:hypothetical protein
MFAVMSLNQTYDGYLKSDDPNLIKIMRISSREESIYENLGQNINPDQVYTWIIKEKSVRVKIKYISNNAMVVVQEVDKNGDWNNDNGIIYGGINNFLDTAVPEVA